MPSRRKKLTGKSMERRLAKGFGQGKGVNYKPYLRVSDVPSNGTSSIITGWKHGREHHFLSRIERNYFYCLEWSDDVLEIREQFPLRPLEATCRIASRLKVRHPQQRGELLLMTTDFLIIVRKDNRISHFARTVKPQSRLKNRRVLEKLEIEKRYFEERGIDWGIITEKEIPDAVWRNIDWVHECRDIRKLAPFSEQDVSRIGNYIASRIEPQSCVKIAQFCNGVDSDLRLAPGSALKIFRHLIAVKALQVDIRVRLRTDVPVLVRSRR
jgi:TnsA endonuclease N terminal/TnsA endonuclease C terminal